MRTFSKAFTGLVLLLAFITTVCAYAEYASNPGSKSATAKCPFLHNQPAAQDPVAPCPLKGKCPFYEAVVKKGPDAHASDMQVDWSKASNCPLAKDCPFLRDAAEKGELTHESQIPKDHFLGMLEKCPRLKTSPQARHHVAEILGVEGEVEAHELAHGGELTGCPYLDNVENTGERATWSNFYKAAEKCPWIGEHGYPAAASAMANSPKGYEAAIQKCPIVQELNAKKMSEKKPESGFIKTLFAYLFPSSPAVNALLATAYISGPPNLLLALVPAGIDPASLSTLVAFAVGGLLGDVFLHLLPQTFMGEPSETAVRFVMVDDKKNLVLGVWIFFGFAIFIILDKSLRIMNGGEGHGHSHGHDHAAPVEKSEASTTSSDVTTTRELRNRKVDVKAPATSAVKVEEPKQQIKFSAYLNLIADAAHNFTDGLALASSFYISPTIGATTTAAVFFHEIPHEVGDFAILIQSGFTKSQAMMSQFITAGGAFAGTLTGIAIQQFSSKSALGASEGLWGTSLRAGDLVLPFTAGGFLYIATSVVPELLEVGPNKGLEIRKMMSQMVAMSVGIAFMYFISD
ncbi:hypothetical protein G7K_6441-t1 [Saitoella complicata NRRL Y-17804]|uniref:Zip-domain-containing protein n=2 Tax=Saitoella complicata (strain BCRC 22490 / CBS 7301 / JCM 7358 / NBRC 10748 / NRRL Y-17804) TaxID=698492 RepID=A0A0E9NRF1_SAICN|nr:hypothetical protein G7K_6441-t1 [Saitoella complicata NRRL Y-17804]